MFGFGYQGEGSSIGTWREGNNNGYQAGDGLYKTWLKALAIWPLPIVNGHVAVVGYPANGEMMNKAYSA